MPPVELPSVPSVLTRRQCLQTAQSIAADQESSGAIPWFSGGHTDQWDHVESAMALTVAGLRDEAVAAYTWSARTQRPDGSWPMQFRDGEVENAATDVNFCAYIATGLWHYLAITGDTAFASEMWPVVRAAIDLVIDCQGDQGQIYWLRDGTDILPEALVTGSASMYHSLGAALELARCLGDPHPEWESARTRLGSALREHPELFTAKDRYSMDWYYPVLGGALRGPAGQARIAERWDTFVVGNIGIRCVSDRPWVTGAETCELVLSLDALGDRDRAHQLFANMQHLRETDGSYWTGLVYADGKRWPVERTTWTGAAVILAADALSRTTPGNGIFRDLAADAVPARPVPLPVSSG
ncbi:prenyltransferase [Nocardia flavorosea]|uniref:Prenyltransferase n=1 Tax=Nocardia flavorosea TaxID=53429 RepID=A0A846YAA3_9NOCA|nr:prenyltransferase [Nocardia flavorosea]NKY54714.1 prenyltransferase [Nocardia flavorosea]